MTADMIGTPHVEYNHNNSGGHWWLTDQNWIDLEAAGWIVEWHKDRPTLMVREDTSRWLGALALSATRPNMSLREAVAEWSNITGLDPLDPGCNCCGEPHMFYSYDAEGKYIASLEIIPSYTADYGDSE